jgi:hypothetical protein
MSLYPLFFMLTTFQFIVQPELPLTATKPSTAFVARFPKLIVDQGQHWFRCTLMLE